MEENTNVTTIGNKSTMMIVGVVIAVLIVAGGAIFLSSRDNTTGPTGAAGTSEESMIPADDSMLDDKNAMIEDNEQMMEEDSMMEDALQIVVEGGSYYFDPEIINVAAGQEVTITLNSVDMMHDFVIDELGIATEIIEGGESSSVTFTAPTTPGEYTFYCSVGNHRAQGMEGTLIVQ